MPSKSVTRNYHEDQTMNVSESDLSTRLIRMERKLDKYGFKWSRKAKNQTLKILTLIRECPSTHPKITRLVLERAFELHTVRGDASFRAELEYTVGLTNQFDVVPKYLHFFLKAANDSKLTLNGIRMQDYLLAVLGRNHYRELTWGNTYTLIKFGTMDLTSSIRYKFDSRVVLTYQDYKGVTIPPYPLLDLLSSLMKEVYNFSRLNYDTAARKNENERCALVLQCIKMVFRAIGMFPIGHLPKCNGLYFIDFGFLEHEMVQSYATMLRLHNELDHFPELEERSNVKVTSLTHLCRMSIRQRLYDNWMLPAGIYKLPLPTRTKMYIDLRSSTI